MLSHINPKTYSMCIQLIKGRSMDLQDNLNLIINNARTHSCGDSTTCSSAGPVKLLIAERIELNTYWGCSDAQFIVSFIKHMCQGRRMQGQQHHWELSLHRMLQMRFDYFPVSTLEGTVHQYMESTSLQVQFNTIVLCNGGFLLDSSQIRGPWPEKC